MAGKIKSTEGRRENILGDFDLSSCEGEKYIYIKFSPEIDYLWGQNSLEISADLENSY